MVAKITGYILVAFAKCSSCTRGNRFRHRRRNIFFPFHSHDNSDQDLAKVDNFRATIHDLVNIINNLTTSLDALTWRPKDIALDPEVLAELNRRKEGLRKMSQESVHWAQQVDMSGRTFGPDVVGVPKQLTTTELADLSDPIRSGLIDELRSTESFIEHQSAFIQLVHEKFRGASVEEFARAIHRIRLIMTQGPVIVENVDLLEWIQSMVGESFVKVKQSGELRRVAIDEAALYRILLNMTKNASEAGAHSVIIELSEQEGAGAVLITIQDDGRGLGGEQLQAIEGVISGRRLTPFSTKEKKGDYKKRGMGLRIIRRGLISLNASVMVESWPQPVYSIMDKSMFFGLDDLNVAREHLVSIEQRITDEIGHVDRLIQIATSENAADPKELEAIERFFQTDLLGKPVDKRSRPSEISEGPFRYFGSKVADDIDSILYRLKRDATKAGRTPDAWVNSKLPKIQQELQATLASLRDAGNQRMERIGTRFTIRLAPAVPADDQEAAVRVARAVLDHQDLPPMAIPFSPGLQLMIKSIIDCYRICESLLKELESQLALGSPDKVKGIVERFRAEIPSLSSELGKLEYSIMGDVNEKRAGNNIGHASTHINSTLLTWGDLWLRLWQDQEQVAEINQRIVPYLTKVRAMLVVYGSLIDNAIFPESPPFFMVPLSVLPLGISAADRSTAQALLDGTNRPEWGKTLLPATYVALYQIQQERGVS